MTVKIALFTSLLLALSACGDANRSGTSANTAGEARISLHVFNDDGPVSRGKIEVRDAEGKPVSRADLDGDPIKAVTISGGARYPLVVWVFPEGDSEPLKAAVTSALVAEQDVSPVTTLVVDAAQSLGGLTEQNLVKAAGAAISQRQTSGGSGTSSGFKGDPTKQYGGWH